MHAANETDTPIYIRLTRDPEPVIFGSDYEFEIGRVITVKEGSDITIFSTGAQTIRCLQAAEKLESQNISAHVIHVPTIKPLDKAAVVKAAAHTGRVVTAEDHTIIGGLGGAIAEILSEEMPTPMKRIGILDTFGESAANEDLLQKYQISYNHVAEAAQKLLQTS
jgi:transketolase